MDIEGLSMSMSQTRVIDAIGTKVLSMSLDMVEQSGADLVEMMDRSMMENSVMPNLGNNIDIMI